MSRPIRAVINGTGMAVPELIITNSDLERLVDTSDQWIVSRTGIRERMKLEAGFSCVDFAEKATREALERLRSCLLPLPMTTASASCHWQGKKRRLPAQR